MSAELGLRPKGAPRSSSIKQISSFLTGVMHSDSKEGEREKKDKDTKKNKEPVSRRTAPRASLDKPSVGVKANTKDTTTPENKTITKANRRLSGLPKPAPASSDEKSSSPSTTVSPKTTIARSSSLRPKPRLSGSALPKPKLRPKSELIQPKKPPSPIRAGTRRHLSSSDDEGDDEGEKPKAPLLHLEIPSSDDKRGRAISPLPHRNALKVNVSLNTRPTTPEMKGKSPSPVPKQSPSRNQGSNSKIGKLTKNSSTVPSRTTVPHPASSPCTAGTTRTHSPKTPKTPPSVRNIFGGPSSANKAKGRHGSSPLRGAHTPDLQDSPLGRIAAQRRSQNSSPSLSNRSTPTPTNYTDGQSIDSIDANDVEMLLGEGVSPAKPTPAIPRFMTTFTADNGNDSPQTPSRSTFLPSRCNLSYLSPTPPTADNNSPFLRPRMLQPGNDRGSILSWEQLAAHNRSMGTDEMGQMLSEMPAPFRPGAISPAPSMLSDIPESPSLSAMPSPTGYGSISQVLLPDVTPSPAPLNLQRFEQGAEVAAADSAIVTLIKLQLASMENLAKERLLTIQSLESQLHKTKETSMRDTEALAGQITVLEEQVRATLQAEEQRVAYTAQLEEQLTRVGGTTQEALSEAVRKAREDAIASQKGVLNMQRLRLECCSVAGRAAISWQMVREKTLDEVDHCHDLRDTLDVLKRQLERIHLQQQLMHS